MTAKEYLERVKELNEYIYYLIDKRAEALSSGGSFCSDKVQSSFRNTTEDKFVKYSDYGTLIDEATDLYINTRRNVIDTIMKLRNPKERRVLILKYICFKSWREIQKKLKTKRNVYYIHNNGLKNITQYIV